MNPVKILSVDDEMDLELLLTQYFRRKIRKGEYEFFFAHNGLEALTVLLREKDINIILSDINMPEMDGLTLLTKINEMHNPAMKCIMVSAYGDMGNIRSAMNNGAFDFATKPIDLDDLSVTIEKAIEQIEYIKKAQAEHSQLESLKTDLAVAREIQQAILPRIFPPFPENSSEIDLAALRDRPGSTDDTGKRCGRRLLRLLPHRREPHRCSDSRRKRKGYSGCYLHGSEPHVDTHRWAAGLPTRKVSDKGERAVER